MSKIIRKPIDNFLIQINKNLSLVNDEIQNIKSSIMKETETNEILKVKKEQFTQQEKHIKELQEILEDIKRKERCLTEDGEKLSKMKNTLDTLKKNINLNSDEKNAMKNDIEKYTQNQKLLDNQILKLTNQKEQITLKITQELGRLQEINKIYTLKFTENQNFNLLLNRIRQECLDVQKQVQDKNIQCDLLNNESDKLDILLELKKNKSAIVQKEINFTQNLIQDTANDVANWVKLSEEQINTLDSDLSELTKQNDSIKHEISINEQAINSQRQYNTDLQKDNNEIKEKLIGLEKKIQSYTEPRAPVLFQQRVSIYNNFLQLQGSVHQQNVIVQKQQTEHAQLDIRIKEFQQELSKTLTNEEIQKQIYEIKSESERYKQEFEIVYHIIQQLVNLGFVSNQISSKRKQVSSLKRVKKHAKYDRPESGDEGEDGSISSFKFENKIDQKTKFF